MGLKCQEILRSLGVQLDPVSELGSLLHPSIHTLGGKMDSYSYTLRPHYLRITAKDEKQNYQNFTRALELHLII